MEYDLRKHISDFEMMTFPDHHNFTDADIENIRTRAAGRTILTTEKDATRLHGLDNMKVIPIEVKFIEGESEFEQLISNYVQINARNNVPNS